MPGGVRLNLAARAAAARDPAALAALPPPVLTAGMRSRRLQALGYVQDYIAAHNQAPSLSEIAGGLGLGKSTVSKLVDKLVAEGALRRVAGARGLLLPSRIDDAKALLRAAGWVVDEDAQRLEPGTKRGLPRPPALDYRPPRDHRPTSDPGLLPGLTRAGMDGMDSDGGSSSAGRCRPGQGGAGARAAG